MASNHSRTLQHLSLAPDGIVYSGGRVTQIVYKTRDCLCELPEDCQPPDSPYYEVRASMHVFLLSPAPADVPLRACRAPCTSMCTPCSAPLHII